MTTPTTVESLERGIKALANLQRRMDDGQWVLIDPTSTVWTGSPKHLMSVLLGRTSIDELLGETDGSAG